MNDLEVVLAGAAIFLVAFVVGLVLGEFFPRGRR